MSIALHGFGTRLLVSKSWCSNIRRPCWLSSFSTPPSSLQAVTTALCDSGASAMLANFGRSPPGIGSVQAIALSSDQSFLLASNSERVVVIDIATGLTRATRNGDSGSSRRPKIAPDDEEIALTSENALVILTTDGPNELVRYQVPGDAVQSCAWSPDGDQLVLGLKSGALCVIDRATLSVVGECKAHSAFGGTLSGTQSAIS